jgi:hypothetical protein
VYLNFVGFEAKMFIGVGCWQLLIAIGAGALPLVGTSRDRRRVAFWIILTTVLLSTLLLMQCMEFVTPLWFALLAVGWVPLQLLIAAYLITVREESSKIRRIFTVLLSLEFLMYTGAGIGIWLTGWQLH